MPPFGEHLLVSVVRDRVSVEDLQDVGPHLRSRLGPLLGLNPDAVDMGLEAKSQALVCLAGLQALSASDATYQSTTNLAND
jgi:hypothetical protein